MIVLKFLLWRISAFLGFVPIHNKSDMEVSNSFVNCSNCVPNFFDLPFSEL